MNIVTIIPARGGSKGIIKKNLRYVGDYTLISRAIMSSCDCALISKTVVATDCNDIAEESKSFGAEIVWRPEDISSDTASSESVLVYSIIQLKEKPDIIVFLQCTSPFIKSSHIEQVIKRLIDSGADSAFAGVLNHRFIWRQDEFNTYGVNHDGKKRLRRQELSPEYTETGAIYAFKTDVFLREKTRFCGRTVICPIDDELLGFEIDSHTDLQICDALSSNRASKFYNIKLLAFDFDGVFTDNKVYLNEEGQEMVTCSRSDGLALRILKKRRPDLYICVISSEKNKVVSSRCKKLGLNYFCGVENKLLLLKDIVSQLSINSDSVVYVGNDINDRQCLKYAGISICPSDAYISIRNQVDIILSNLGGNGAVREVCEMFR